MVRAVFPTPPSPRTTSLYSTMRPAMLGDFILRSEDLGSLVRGRWMKVEVVLCFWASGRGGVQKQREVAAAGGRALGQSAAVFWEREGPFGGCAGGGGGICVWSKQG